ncbi:hypothetical protein BMF94_2689 [Rhodotorula taiwanensis]|uniref:Proteophosphoglycan ppg4 n=1 Tax=Rhodotorula taiwanensis TaxID=741276 RepID=A0A2S5BBY2_9BASI|nr:hypothetical protein BMF94_2689 [Rhodotorula taiwanensis]
METKALVDQTAVEETLSALSTQLVSLGYLARPLDLATLFLAPSLPAGASSKHVRKHQDLLILQARAREQIAKCLWGMLEQRQEERATIETLLAREARANEDAERERKQADRARKEREAMGREVEAEKARAKEAEQKLKTEQERHRHARDELAKAKNALQFVKTQALHDQKRRESEVQSLHQRLQKLTTAPASSSSEAAFTRFTILNGASSPASSSPTSAHFGGRSARAPARAGASTAAPSASTAAIEAELELVRSTLDERISVCSHLQQENRELRTFVGEVGEWTDDVLEFEEMANVRKDREEGGEMRGVLGHGDEVIRSREGLPESVEMLMLVAAQSYMIPSPHLALPVPTLTDPLHRKLYAIRLGLSSLSEQSAATLAALRDELEGEIERLNEEVEEEVQRREETEQERETALEAVKKGEMLVEEWAAKAQKERKRRLTGSPGSDDEATEERPVAKEPRAVEAPARDRSDKHKDGSSSSRAARPSAPSAHVASFFADLGLDTPAGEKEKVPLRSEKPARQERDSDSRRREARSREASAADKKSPEQEVEGAMLPPSRTSRITGTRPVSASSSRTSVASSILAPSSRTPAEANSASSSRPRSRQSVEAPPASTRPGPSSTLQDILALADSPPVTTEPLVSTAVRTARSVSSSRVERERTRERERAVLVPSSRAVNAPSEDKTEVLDDRVAAKREALLARAHATSARKAAQE